MKRMLLAAIMAAGLTCATPALAQSDTYTPGPYWVVQGIYVEDGQLENYMDFIADRYRRSQEIARQRGWITSYRIFGNVNRRDDEPHLFLITEMPRLATPQEDQERERIVNQQLQETTRQATEASGQRVRMRRLGSNILLQELVLRPAR